MRVQPLTPPLTPPLVRRPSAAPPPAALATPAVVARATAPVMSGVQAVPKGITVDVNGHVSADGGLAATGTVTLDHTFMERIVRHVTRKQAFGHRDVRFDPASGTYKGSVELKVKGFTLKLLGKAVPVADGNLPGFKFEELAVKIGPITLRGGWVRQLAAKLIANEITAGGITATPAKGGVIRLDPTTLLYDAEVLPPSFYLDTKRTRFGVSTGLNGDVRIRLESDQPAPPADKSPRSNLAFSFDEQALLRVLTPVLAPDYELSGVTVKPGAIVLDGRVEAKPISDVVNVARGLLAAFVAARGGPHREVYSERAMLSLKLDAKLQGTQILLTPSLSLALGDLEKTLAKAGLKPVREGQSLRFDVAPLVARYGVEGIQAVAGQVKGRAELDLNALLKAPILRGEKW